MRRAKLRTSDWTLHATLLLTAIHRLRVPAPMRTTDATYTVASIRLTGSELEIHWTATGPINDQLDRLFHEVFSGAAC